MKKIMSLVMVAAMLTVLFVLPASAERTNVDATALKFTSAPTIDGMISAEEWGQSTFTVKANEAAVKDDEGPNALNTFIGFNDEDGKINPYTEADLAFFSYETWLRWDDENMYIGVVVNDPDGHSLPKGRDDIWNGDVVQFIIDTKGPNSVIKESAPDLNFNYLTDTYNGRRFRRPFGSWKTLPNIGMGLVKGSEVQVYNMVEDESLKGIIEEAECAIVSNETQNEDGSVTCVTTYELRMPWTTFDKEFVPSTEAVLGMSLVVIDSFGAEMSSYLTWGNGICNGQGEKYPKTLGGSNVLLLSEETVTPDPNAPKIETTESQTEAPTEAPKVTESNKSNESTTPAPVTNRNISNADDEGFPVWAWVVIAVAVVVVAAVIVVVIVKKNKKEKK